MNSEAEKMIAMAGFSNQQMQGLMQGVDGGETESVSKELFGGSDDIRQKSDLTDEELKAIALLLYYGRLIKYPRLKVLLNDFMTLKTSLKRQSRKEFVQSLTGQDAFARQGNMLSRLFSR